MSLLKGAVISRDGLGDGLVALILAHNLHLNGWDVTMYQKGICDQLQAWLSHINLKKGYSVDDVEDMLKKYDRIFIFYCEKDPFTHQIIEKGKKIDELKVTVINPCFSKNIGNQPYYEDSLFDPELSIVANMEKFCREVLRLPKTTKHNGIVPAEHLKYQKNKKRICIHATSSREGKNWPIEKFTELADQMRKDSYDPVFIMSKEEQEKCLSSIKDFSFPIFANLIELASFIYESGYFIGNDSGVGHLASCLGIPTITLTRGKRISKLWRPSWTEGKVIYPNPMIPNISGLRLRDRYWKNFVTVKKVLDSFYQLKEKSEAV